MKKVVLAQLFGLIFLVLSCVSIPRINQGEQKEVSPKGASISFGDLFIEAKNKEKHINRILIDLPQARTAVEEYLISKNYRVFREDVFSFQPDLEPTPRFVLSVKVNDFEYYSNTKVTTRWFLLDNLTGEVFKTEEIQILISSIQKLGYYYNIEYLLYDIILESLKKIPQEFTDRVQNGESNLSGDSLFEPIMIAISTPNSMKPVEQMNNAVVMIKSGMNSGTGFFISNDGYLLTAAHVVSGLKEVGIRFEDGSWTKATVVRVSYLSDCALLKADKTIRSPFPVSFSKLELGHPVQIIGTPLAKTYLNTLTDGIISKQLEFDGVLYYQTTAYANPGNSGGPLINQSGAVTGIVSSISIRLGSSMTNCVSIENVYKSLNIVAQKNGGKK